MAVSTGSGGRDEDVGGEKIEERKVGEQMERRDMKRKPSRRWGENLN